MNRILTIDDAFENNRLIELFFQKKYQIITAIDGIEGFEKAKSIIPDVILLDVMMPKIDGIEVLKELKTNQITKSIPVIMVTAKSQISDVKTAIENGALDYVKKPIDFVELTEKIELALKISEPKNKSNNEYINNVYQNLIEARRLQKSLSPDKKSFMSIFPSNFVIDLPQNIVSGDFYQVHTHNNKKYICMFDCTGHGLPGAMLSMVGQALLSQIFETNAEIAPSEILTKLTKEFIQILSRSSDTYTKYNGMDGIVCCFDEKESTLTYSSAMCPLVLSKYRQSILKIDDREMRPLISNSEYNLFLLKGDRKPIGLGNFDNNIIFNDHKVNIAPNDTIYLFSDGITNQLSIMKNENLSPRILFSFILEIQSKDMLMQKSKSYQKLNEWKGNTDQIDDFLFIGIKFQPSLKQSSFLLDFIN